MSLELTASLADRIAERIRDGIIRGRFRPGQRLTESAIVEWLNVSNSPVREAFHQLEQDGLVVREPRRGARVKEFCEQDIKHLYMVRSALDGVAYMLLLEDGALHEDVYDRLRACVDDQARSAEAGDYSQSIEHDLRFHDIVFESADADVLWNLWSVIRAQFRVLLHWRLQSHKRRGDPVGVAALHHTILDGLRDGDLNALKEHTGRRHVENAQDLVDVLQERKSVGPNKRGAGIASQ